MFVCFFVGMNACTESEFMIVESHHRWYVCMHAGVSSDAKIAFFDVGPPGVTCPESKDSTGGGLLFPSNLNTGMFSVMYNGPGAPRIFSNSWGTNTNAYDSYSVQTDLVSMHALHLYYHLPSLTDSKPLY